MSPLAWHPGEGRYLGLVQGLQRLMVSPGLSASVYTEITDVEGEINGFFTYDRAILKVDLNQVRTVHLNLIPASRQLNDRQHSARTRVRKDNRSDPSDSPDQRVDWH